MTPDKKHLEHTHTGPSSQKLPEHLRHLSEGAIIDWLIRTGQWDPNAQTEFEVPAATESDMLPLKHTTKQDEQ